ncbi:MAG: hypothetical protein IJY40_06340 [Oscillospiraceae bacterium]|nr:hypothetical protein [Oscillospiraceae bacterium]
MDEQNLEFQAQEQAAPAIPETDTPIVTPTAQRRKRRKSKKQIFKEKYLPFIILGVSGLLCLSFIFGSISLHRERDAAKAKNDRISQLLTDEAESLKSRAAAMAAEYDYENAMKTLAGYSGGLANHKELLGLYNGYKAALNDLVVWDDLSKIPNLSFRTLMADLSKAAADPDRGSRYLKNYITTGEFSAILDQLYANGYVLVSLYDFAVPVTNEDGSVGVNRTSIRLPEGKKPIILTQEGVNYYSHMENCGGFADSLVVNASGELTCRLGETEGAFDLVPVLNDFLAQHPDFSYEGARATIALSGYEGLFGMGLDQSEAIQAVADKLRAQGYDIACYTYADMEYADFGAAGVQEDLDKWNAEIVPVLGSTDILVYPTGGDIKGQEAYTGSKYDALHTGGFRYFVGVSNGTQWGMTTGEYARQTRTLVTGANLSDHPDWFEGMFDAASVLSPDRG